MCSMPQKHPAASVALSAPSGMFVILLELASGVKRIVDEVKGRVNRWKIEAMTGNVMRDIRKIKSLVMGFSLSIVDGVSEERMR